MVIELMNGVWYASMALQLAACSLVILGVDLLIRSTVYAEASYFFLFSTKTDCPPKAVRL